MKINTTESRKGRNWNAAAWCCLVGLVCGSLHAGEADNNNITTLDGRTYARAEVQRAEPDGLIISYQPARGGMGGAKLKFITLPAELRQKYGYDPKQAAAFEAEQTEGLIALQDRYWAEYQDGTNRLAIRLTAEARQAEIEAEQLGQQQAAEDEAMRMAAARQAAEAQLTLENQNYYNPYWNDNYYGPMYGYGYYHRIPLITTRKAAAMVHAALAGHVTKASNGTFGGHNSNPGNDRFASFGNHGGFDWKKGEEQR